MIILKDAYISHYFLINLFGKRNCIPPWSERKHHLLWKYFGVFLVFYSIFGCLNYSFHSILFCISFRWTAQWSDHHLVYAGIPLIVSRTPLAPQRAITTLLTIFPVPHFTSPWPFCNYQSVLLNALTFATQSSDLPPLWQLSVC